jgi:murein DD-endopeptidase MepM/ murein hydrolase activator NlpD
MVHPSQRRPNYAARASSWSLSIKHGGATRTFAIRPIVAAPIAGVLVLLLTVYVGATGYLIYRDDLVGAAVSRQVSMQYAYEERIAALRSELDRLTSRHAVQAEGVEQQLSALLEQQATIQERQSALDGIVQRARTAGVDVGAVARVPQARPDTETPSGDIPADSDEGTIGPLGYMPTQDSSADDAITKLLLKPENVEPTRTLPANIQPTLSKVRASLDSTEDDLSKTLDVLSTTVESKADRLSAALARVGVAGPADEGNAEGGPFIPASGLHFVEKAALLDHTLDDIAALREAALALPVSVPVGSNHISSRFGFRRDPFLHRPGFHAGLDFVAAPGSIVHATAAGRVIAAGWSGGYGQMVEIEHANGVSTRYGHLSAILVRVGAKVAAGAPIGLVGSTGRSTGPHLHYETRRDGNAVNPALYLAAGRALRDPS